ncbi:hypothetical protein M3Y97_00937100 [Aphelenchoides bicaudatus]|nr:hypothetical protein M3Y97_00937100 [Aphelenchoides bicaudatus]
MTKHLIFLFICQFVYSQSNDSVKQLSNVASVECFKEVTENPKNKWSNYLLCNQKREQCSPPGCKQFRYCCQDKCPLKSLFSWEGHKCRGVFSLSKDSYCDCGDNSILKPLLFVFLVISGVLLIMLFFYCFMKIVDKYLSFYPTRNESYTAGRRS